MTSMKDTVKVSYLDCSWVRNHERQSRARQDIELENSQHCSLHFAAYPKPKHTTHATNDINTMLCKLVMPFSPDTEEIPGQVWYMWESQHHADCTQSHK
jgi:hypothetical protein